MVSTNSPSPSLSCTSSRPKILDYCHTILAQTVKPVGITRAWSVLTNKEKASLYSETCSSVRESAWSRRPWSVLFLFLFFFFSCNMTFTIFRVLCLCPAHSAGIDTRQSWQYLLSCLAGRKGDVSGCTWQETYHIDNYSERREWMKKIGRKDAEKAWMVRVVLSCRVRCRELVVGWSCPFLLLLMKKAQPQMLYTERGIA